MWQVCVPAWGEYHVGLARLITLPALIEAAKLATVPIHFIVHTDRPGELEDVFGDCSHTISVIRKTRVTSGRSSNLMALASMHRKLIAEARPGDYVAPLAADCFVSREFFCAAERRLSEGKRVVLCVPVKTLGEPPPAGATASTTANWTWRHLHPLAIDAVWGSHRVFQPSIIYQMSGSNVACNAFNLHPVAVSITNRPVEYRHTVDYDLVTAFSEAECHIVTDSAEMAIVDMSPADMQWHESLEMGQPNATPEWLAGWAMRNTLPRHRWFFGHRLMLHGEDCLSNDPVPEVVRLMEALET